MIVNIGSIKYQVKFKREGFKTYCMILDTNAIYVDKSSNGISYCHPIEDQWDSGIGRRIALARALADRSRIVRKVFWEVYYKTYPDLMEMNKKRKQELLAQKTSRPKKKRLGYFRRLFKVLFNR